MLKILNPTNEKSMRAGIMDSAQGDAKVTLSSQHMRGGICLYAVNTIENRCNELSTEHYSLEDIITLNVICHIHYSI